MAAILSITFLRLARETSASKRALSALTVVNLSSIQITSIGSTAVNSAINSLISYALKPIEPSIFFGKPTTS